MDKKHFENKKVWITGASKGIGKALAIELASRGAILALSARDETALNEIASQLEQSRVVSMPFDVTHKQANILAAKNIVSELGGIDIAIFNAGSAEYVDISKFDSNVFKRMIKTNFLSMVYGVEAVLPFLRLSSYPQLVAMSSTASYAGLPRSEAYGASHHHRHSDSDEPSIKKFCIFVFQNQ